MEEAADPDRSGALNRWAYGQTHPDAAVGAFALEAVEALGMGKDEIPDYLGLSFSQADAIGHAYGPRSQEQLENLLHLDRVLGELMAGLDELVGEGRWLLALSGDHGTMDVPEHLYNQGEVYNLSVTKGTLTAEDRFKINEHMISTIKMLESLPFPEELKNVPRYASTHHETMRGSGYPRKLPGEQLSTPERILAVADVFEALTASDRPYKKAKSVSVAIEIMHKMVLDNHLDRGCFELFLRSGVYRKYAQQFLAADQLEDLDITKYLSAA
jgi:hypothetical protein